MELHYAKKPIISQLIQYIILMLLSHCGLYSCEYEYLNFAVNSPKNCDWIVSIFISVTPRSSLDLSLPISHEYITNAYQSLPMLVNALWIANDCCQCCKWANARFTNVAYGFTMLTKIDGEWPSSQYSLKFHWKFTENS